WPMLLVALLSATLMWRTFQTLGTEPLARHTAQDRGPLLVWAAVVILSCGWLTWLARPDFMPLSRGPDLTPHLLLVDYIERHWRLVHDPSLAALMGEMAQYTPGSHLLAAFAGVWSHTDGLRALHVLLSVTVALKAGFVFLIAMRTLPAHVPRLQLS